MTSYDQSLPQKKFLDDFWDREAGGHYEIPDELNKKYYLFATSLFGETGVQFFEQYLDGLNLLSFGGQWNWIIEYHEEQK